MNYFDNIYDLPIVRYHKIIEETSLKYLMHDVNEFKESEELEKVWENINIQIIDEFGLSHESEIIFYKQNTINRLEIKSLLGDKSEETACELLKLEVAQLKSKQKPPKDIRKYHARLHRILHSHYGRPTHDLSTFEFFNDLQDMQKEQEKDNYKRHLKTA